MDACSKHRNSKNPKWREAMNLLWDNYWSHQESDILKKYNAVSAQFTRKNKKGKMQYFKNWSGKDIRQMASEVDHIEAYDIFYSELSSFTHADVHMADKFLQNRPAGPVWSQRADEGDVGNVFKHAATFLTCYLKLFGKEFNSWTVDEVEKCWDLNGNNISFLSDAT
jgi:hypothetical protein